jgi:hypothetical protein
VRSTSIEESCSEAVFGSVDVVGDDCGRRAFTWVAKGGIEDDCVNGDVEVCYYESVA